MTYRLLYANHFEDLLEEINELAKDGWKITATIQEHGYTKVILQKEI